VNHVPETWMRWMRRAFFVYGLHFFVGYLLVAFVQGKGPKGAGAYDITVALVFLVYASYELFGLLWLNKRYPSVAALLSLSFILLISFIAGEYTGVYQSPYLWAAVPLTFMAAALGDIYAPLTIFFILILGFLLGLAGAFTTPTDIPLGIVTIAADFAAGAVGYIFWRRYYVNHKQDSDTAQLNANLLDEKRRSEIILNSIEDGVMLVDADRNIRLFNPSATRITGWKTGEAIGLDYRNVLKLFGEKDQLYTETQDPFSQALNQKKTIRDNQAILKTRGDKQISLGISVSPLMDTNQVVFGMVAIFRDISSEKEEEQRRADFISTASHEMRTPVAAIEGYLALALNDRVSTIDSKAREYLEKAHESTQHLGSLFQDLLTSAKAEDGRLSNHPGVVEMGAYIEKLAEDLRFSAEKKGLHMEFVMGAADQPMNASGKRDTKLIKPLYYTFVDADRLSEVITNLFDNAVKYTESGTVSLGLTGNDKVVQVYVRDTGPGIAAEDIPHLFQKFYRVDNSATRTIGGTGLGLFIAKRIIEMYEGRIWVESQLGQGSTFFINLPRMTSQRAEQLKVDTPVATVDATKKTS
jgi:PAS domain S-box-containing protein